MKTELISVEEFQEQSDTLIRQAAGRVNRIAVAQNGQIVAALVSASDLERLEEMEQRREERIRLVKSIRENFAGIPEDELIREGETALREVRENMDLERATATEAIQAAGWLPSKEELLKIAEPPSAKFMIVAITASIAMPEQSSAKHRCLDQGAQP